jgi:hypothetical protein
MMGGIGQMIFSTLFNFLLVLLFAPKPKDTISYGPRMDNLKPAIKDIQGQVINLTYGTTRVSGTVFWASDIRETVHKEVTEMSSKGGGSDYTHTEVTYTYDCDLAVGISEGPVVGIRKIWANKELIYNVDVVPNRLSWLKFILYTGTEEQAPSPILQSYNGFNVTPAHRGLAYIVFDHFQLDPFGRRVPQSIEFEIVAKGTLNGNAYKYPEVDYVKFNDYGNRISGWEKRNLFFPMSTQEVAFPLNGSGYTQYAVLNTSTNQITKRRFDSRVGINTGSIYYSSGTFKYTYGDEPYFVWMKVSFMGVNFKHVPCLLYARDIDIGNLNSIAGVQIFNLINGRLIANISLPDCFLIGSFNQGATLGPYYGKLYGVHYFDGTNSTFWLDEFRDKIAVIETNPENIDDYGFSKGTVNTFYLYNKESPTKYYRALESFGIGEYVCHLAGFPTVETTGCEVDEFGNIIFTPGGVLETRTYSYEILDIYAPHLSAHTDTAFIDYEYNNFSQDDFLDKDIAYVVKIRVTESINTSSCDGTFNDSIDVNVKEYWYPAVLGPTNRLYDADPLPAEGPPPAEQHKSMLAIRNLFVNYIVGWPEADVSGYDSIHKWIRFKDGRELLCMYSDKLNKYFILRKGNYEINEYPRTRQGFEDVFGFAPTYDVIAGGLYDLVYRTFRRSYVKPGQFWKDPEQGAPYNMEYTDEYSTLITEDSEGYYGCSCKPFFILNSSNVYIPRNAYWRNGDTKIFWASGSSVYSYDLISDVAQVEFSTSVNMTALMPFSEDYIAEYISAGDTYGWAANVYYVQRNINAQPALLGAIIEDLSTKAGIDLSILDISDTVYYTEVYGYNVSDDMKILDGLEPLLMHFFIDAFESDWKIKFRARKEFLNNNIEEIPLDELGSKNLNEDFNEKYKVIVREDIQLPQTVNYSYIAAENSFVQANVIAIRNIDFNLGIKTSIKCPIALLTNTAYSNAFRILFDIWRSTKEFEFRLPRKYAFLEPGDVIKLPIVSDTNEYAIVKIFEITGDSKAFLEVKGVEEDARDLDGLIIDGAFEKEINTLVPLTPSFGTYYDIKPLYNKFYIKDYTTPGLYYSIYGSSPYWRGGGIYASYDNISYFNVDSFGPSQAPTGIVSSVTNYIINPAYIDYINTITIQLTSSSDFYNVSDDDFWYKEGNLIAIKSYTTGHVELLQYKNISRNVDNPKLITLSTLVRGLYDSYNASISFTYDDTVTLLPTGTKKLELDTSKYNETVYYKLVSYNQSTDSVMGIPLKYKLNWYKPYRSSSFTASVSGSDIVLTWVPRERNKPAYLLFTPEVIDAQEYKINIYNSITNTLLRTYTAILSNTKTYTAADMTTDGVTTSSILKFELIRKAPFLEYNHDVSNTCYINNTNLPLVYEALTNNNLVYYIDFEKQTNLVINPSNNEAGATLTYNNYNGLGYPTPKNPLFSTTSCGFKWNDSSRLINFPAWSTFSIVFWIKLDNFTIGGASSDCFTILKTDELTTGVEVKTYSASTSLQLGIDIEGFNTYSAKNLSNGVWYFFYTSYRYVSGRPIATYCKSLDGTYLYTYAANSNTYFNHNLGGSSTCFYNYPTSNYKTREITMQDFAVFAADLYYQSGSNWDIVNKLYEAGKTKWQQQ